MGENGKSTQIASFPDMPAAPVVRVRDGAVYADSREVAAYFGKQHKDVLRDIRRLHCSAEFAGRNFAPCKINDLTGEATSHVEMTKDGFAFLVMGFTGEHAGRFKEAYIGAFNRMESELRSQPAVDTMKVLNDPAAMRGLLLTYSEKVMALQSEVDAMSPKVDALDRLAEADGSLCITDSAKTLQVRPKQLFDFLRSHGWIYRRPGTDHDVAYQSKLAAGLMEHKTTTVYRSDGSEKVTTQVRVTPKGLARLAQELPPVAKMA